MSAAPLTSVTGEPIVAGRIARVQFDSTGLRPGAIAGVTPRGAVDVRPLTPDATRWAAPRRLPADAVWFLLSDREARQFELPKVPA